MLYRAENIEIENKVYKNIQSYWGVEQVYCYDPAYPPLSHRPGWRFDGVICTDVLEHCPEEDIPWILGEIFAYARRFVFANIASYPAEKVLPNGENAHCTVRPVEWWLDRVREVAPQVPFQVVVTSKRFENGEPRYEHQWISNVPTTV